MNTSRTRRLADGIIGGATAYGERLQQRLMEQWKKGPLTSRVVIAVAGGLIVVVPLVLSFIVATDWSQNAAAYHARGYAHGESGQWEEAVADYDKAIALDPNVAWTYHNLGYVQQVREYEQAIAGSTRPSRWARAKPGPIRSRDMHTALRQV
jgi:tetratricopeptide (TPR) repeat protein